MDFATMPDNLWFRYMRTCKVLTAAFGIKSDTKETRQLITLLGNACNLSAAADCLTRMKSIQRSPALTKSLEMDHDLSPRRDRFCIRLLTRGIVLWNRLNAVSRRPALPGSSL